MKRIVRAELVPAAPIPELAWKVLEAPGTSPRLRYEVAADVLASDASDRAAALERLPRVHGVGTLVLVESFAAGAPLRAQMSELLESAIAIRALPGDPSGETFDRWLMERAGAGVGLRLQDLAAQVARVHTGLLPRDVPSDLYASLRRSPSGTCAQPDEPCRRLLADVLRATTDESGEPPPELWPELGKGALSAWLVDGTSGWIARAPTEGERTARIVAAIAHPEHDGLGADPVAALTWGAGTAGVTAALASELARRAGVAVDLSVNESGVLHVALATTALDVAGAAYAGPLPHPSDLLRADAIRQALELGDLIRAQDVAAAFEDPTTAWAASRLGEIRALEPPAPAKKKQRRR
jgi:hypothetical protein